MADEIKTESVDNIIYVGDKMLVIYCNALLRQKDLGHKEIMIKARGKNISRAVDLLEMSKNKELIKDFDSTIETSTEPYKFMKDNKEVNIRKSSITIILKKKQ